MSVYKASVKVSMMLDVEVLADDEIKAQKYVAEIAKNQAEAWTRWRREDVTHAICDDVSVRCVDEEVF